MVGEIKSLGESIVVCVEANTVDNTPPGVTREAVDMGGVSPEKDGGCGGGTTRSAGFGNVLYVEPRDVYLEQYRD